MGVSVIGRCGVPALSGIAKSVSSFASSTGGGLPGSTSTVMISSDASVRGGRSGASVESALMLRAWPDCGVSPISSKSVLRLSVSVPGPGSSSS